jgi:RNA polymerase sigma-70 factor (ECF subfamily)
MAVDRNLVIKTLLTDRVGLFSYIWTIVGDEHLAEDVFQEVSMLAIDKAPEIEAAGALGVWIRRAARNLALQALRKRGRDRHVFDDALLDQLDADWRGYGAGDEADSIDALRECLGKLTPHGQQVVRLRYVEGLTGQKLAAAMGRSLTAAYIAVSRANRTLAECVRRRLGREGAADA